MVVQMNSGIALLWKHSLDFFLFVFLNHVLAEGCLEVGTLLILANLPGFCISKKASLLSNISMVMKMKTISFCFAGFVWRPVASLYKFLNTLPIWSIASLNLCWELNALRDVSQMTWFCQCAVLQLFSGECNIVVSSCLEKLVGLKSVPGDQYR